jgi:hypothetical protein
MNMGEARERDQADFDLEAFIELFDEALTSDDPSVQKTLQHLMVICALARNHDKHNHRRGPLRRLYEDLHNINRRLERVEVTIPATGGGYNPGAPHRPGPPIMPQPIGIPNTGHWPGGGYNTIWTTSTQANWGKPPTAVASAGSTGDAIAERVENLLKDEKYKGSSVGTVNVKIA